MILIALGSSLTFCGRTSPQLLDAATRSLARLGRVARRSRIYRSPAWPDPSDPPFFNACVALDTALSPQALLAAMQGIEAGFGRVRTRRFGPRTLDLDLIDYCSLVATWSGPPTLTLPHPEAHRRDFVLRPLVEVAPDWKRPGTGENVQVLLGKLETTTTPWDGEG
ncbi:MAG: 2-amino-4-hydroxy-6-hydroxymethyldihydropteridine diphosphokinase [Parvularculaceae bacterium]|nr:2-amino-4-hydroxy-6-hydroxymethyldihydropteridine diphosphokinase [Parvularculaceae bacterium]